MRTRRTIDVRAMSTGATLGRRVATAVSIPFATSVPGAGSIARKEAVKTCEGLLQRPGAAAGDPGAERLLVLVAQVTGDRLLQVVLEPLAARRVAQLAQRLGLDLA